MVTLKVLPPGVFSFFNVLFINLHLLLPPQGRLPAQKVPVHPGLFVPPGCVALHVPQKDLPCRCEFIPDESQPQHPAPHRVLFVVGLLGLRACRSDHLGKLAHCEAKLDIGFHLTGVQSVALSVRWVCELEKAEFNGPFCKGGMEVPSLMLSST